jgi:hypothetical protein
LPNNSLGILLVGHIRERSHILVRDTALRGRSFLLLVLPDKGEAQDQKDAELEAVGDEERSDAELVSRRLTGQVEERRDNVTDACAYSSSCSVAPYDVSTLELAIRTEPDHSACNHLLALALLGRQYDV